MPLADIVRGDSSRQVDLQTERRNLIRRARLEVPEPASYADRRLPNRRGLDGE